MNNRYVNQHSYGLSVYSVWFSTCITLCSYVIILVLLILLLIYSYSYLNGVFTHMITDDR